MKQIIIFLRNREAREGEGDFCQTITLLSIILFQCSQQPFLPVAVAAPKLSFPQASSSHTCTKAAVASHGPQQAPDTCQLVVSGSSYKQLGPKSR